VSLDLRPPGAAETRRLLGILSRPAAEAARLLLGQVLVRRLGHRRIAARLVETEAYRGALDPAAHAYRGRTRRTEPLWGPPGTVYVYFIYGMYYCLNLVADRKDVPECVLVRAAEPLADSLPPLSCSGPGRLCRSLDLDTRLSGAYLFGARSSLYLREGRPPARIATSPRVGIRHAAEEVLRFFDPASPAVSAFRPSRPRVGPSGRTQPHRRPSPARR
jgi:DNA-3-methyladenine glycosylase